MYLYTYVWTTVVFSFFFSPRRLFFSKAAALSSSHKLSLSDTSLFTGWLKALVFLNRARTNLCCGITWHWLVTILPWMWVGNTVGSVVLRPPRLSRWDDCRCARKVAAVFFVAAVAISVGWHVSSLVFSLLSKLLCAFARWSHLARCSSFGVRATLRLVGWSCRDVAVCFSLLTSPVCMRGWQVGINQIRLPPWIDWAPTLLERSFGSLTSNLQPILLRSFPPLPNFFFVTTTGCVQSYFSVVLFVFGEIVTFAAWLITDRKQKRVWKKKFFLSKWMSKTRNRGEKKK